MRFAAISCVVLLTTAACNGRADTADNVRKALDQANVRGVRVEVDDEARVVHLHGTVETIADRTRANEIASAVVGTSGHVLNDLTVEGLTGRRLPGDVDGQLTDAVDAILDKDPILRERDVNIQVTGGTVTISGEVRTETEKNRADRLVRRAPGVKAVANDLRIVNER